MPPASLTVCASHAAHDRHHAALEQREAERRANRQRARRIAQRQEMHHRRKIPPTTPPTTLPIAPIGPPPGARAQPRPRLDLPASVAEALSLKSASCCGASRKPVLG